MRLGFDPSLGRGLRLYWDVALALWASFTLATGQDMGLNVSWSLGGDLRLDGDCALSLGGHFSKSLNPFSGGWDYKRDLSLRHGTRVVLLGNVGLLLLYQCSLVLF